MSQDDILCRQHFCNTTFSLCSNKLHKYQLVGTLENLGLGGLVKLPGEHFEAKFNCLFIHDVSQSFIFSESLSEGTFGLFLGRNGTKKDLVYTIGLSIY